MNPKVSVIMSVYNGERFIVQTIESILDQTFKNFELIIVDDHSTDKTASLIAAFNDFRIKVIKNNKNIGLTKSLNIAIGHAEGEFIARIDADDIAYALRLERQVEYLEKNLEFAMCGTWADIIDIESKIIGEYKTPVTNKSIRKMIFFHNPFIHPSVMIRKKALIEIGLYNENLRYIQDYELWTRIIATYQVANIPEKLLQYRVFKGNITSRYGFKVRIIGLWVRGLALKRLFLN